MFARLMGLRTISPADLHRMIGTGEVVAIDVNSPSSWSAAHVPGARNLDPKDFAATELPEDRATPLVFYCSNPLCRKAPSAALRAKKLGFENVRVLSAGIQGWVGAGLPTESGN